MARLRSRWPDLRSERGSNLIEMALVFPIMAILTVGFMDFSMAMWSQHTLAHAAREGARFATLRQPANDDQIIAVIKDAAVGLNQDNITVDIVWDPNKQPGSTVSISVQYIFNPVTPFVGPHSQSLEGRAAMVVLR